MVCWFINPIFTSNLIYSPNRNLSLLSNAKLQESRSVFLIRSVWTVSLISTASVKKWKHNPNPLKCYFIQCTLSVILLSPKSNNSYLNYFICLCADSSTPYTQSTYIFNTQDVRWKFIYTHIKEIVFSMDMVNKQIHQLANKHASGSLTKKRHPYP